MAENTREAKKDKKTVPVNILLTDDANVALGRFALQRSTAEMRISKSDVVRATIQAGLPFLDLVHTLSPTLPMAQALELLTDPSVSDAVAKLVQEHAAVGKTPRVITRGRIPTRGRTPESDEALARPVEGTDLALVSPVNTGVHQAPTFSWRLPMRLLAAHLSTAPEAPLQCRVHVFEDAQPVWTDEVELTLARGATPEAEAQRLHAVAMPAAVFERLTTLSWKRWTVQVTYHASTGVQTAEATALFLKVMVHQAAHATVEGFLAQGHAHAAQGLVEEAAAFFRTALEQACQQLVALARLQGVAQADDYQRLLEAITRLP